jgi:hypothetical protein
MLLSAKVREQESLLGELPVGTRAWRYLNDWSPSRTRPEITEARATSPTEQNPEICAHDGTEASTADW